MSYINLEEIKNETIYIDTGDNISEYNTDAKITVEKSDVYLDFEFTTKKIKKGFAKYIVKQINCNNYEHVKLDGLLKERNVSVFFTLRENKNVFDRYGRLKSIKKIKIKINSIIFNSEKEFSNLKITYDYSKMLISDINKLVETSPLSLNNDSKTINIFIDYKKRELSFYFEPIKINARECLEIISFLTEILSLFAGETVKPIKINIDNNNSLIYCNWDYIRNTSYKDAEMINRSLLESNLINVTDKCYEMIKDVDKEENFYWIALKKIFNYFNVDNNLLYEEDIEDYLRMSIYRAMEYAETYYNAFLKQNGYIIYVPFEIKHLIYELKDKGISIEYNEEYVIEDWSKLKYINIILLLSVLLELGFDEDSLYKNYEKAFKNYLNM